MGIMVMNCTLIGLRKEPEKVVLDPTNKTIYIFIISCFESKHLIPKVSDHYSYISQ